MHLYYSIVDPYPAYRADLAELFAVELSKLGLQTEWYMRREGGPAGNAHAYQQQQVHRTWAYPGMPRPLAHLSYWLTDCYQLLALLGKKVDAIQCRDKYLASLLSLLVARLRGVPFFYWCSYPFPEQDALVAETRHGWKRSLSHVKAKVRFFILYRLICRWADHVFVQSRQMQEDMAGYGIDPSHMTPVPMGVAARMADWAKQNPVDIVPQRIVYLGTLSAIRKLDMLLDAFLLVLKDFPKAELVFVGEGDHPGERALLEEQVAKLGITSQVRFTGFIPMEEAWKFAASAAICLSPFYPTKVLRSTSPTKLIEYLALGRPVVCNDHPEQSDIIAQSGAGLCVPWGASEFAQAMNWMLTNPDKAESMAKRGPGWIARERTYPIIAKRVWQKYTELTGKTL